MALFPPIYDAELLRKVTQNSTNEKFSAIRQRDPRERIIILLSDSLFRVASENSSSEGGRPFEFLRSALDPAGRRRVCYVRAIPETRNGPV